MPTRLRQRPPSCGRPPRNDLAVWPVVSPRRRRLAGSLVVGHPRQPQVVAAALVGGEVLLPRADRSCRPCPTGRAVREELVRPSPDEAKAAFRAEYEPWQDPNRPCCLTVRHGTVHSRRSNQALTAVQTSEAVTLAHLIGRCADLHTTNKCLTYEIRAKKIA